MRNHPSTLSNNEPARPLVPALGKAVKILEVVSKSPEPMGTSDIARSVRLSKSTVHGLITTLLHERLLATVDGRKGYTLGPRLVELGIRARDQRLLDIAESELQSLVLRTGETGLFGRLNGNRVLILARRESSRLLNLSAPVGSSVPVMAGALGKAYLGAMTPSAARDYLERTVLPAYTDRSITGIGAYLDQVQQARDRGYATDRGEYLPGISAVASAFHWLGGTYFAWIVGIASTYNSVELDQVGAAVRDAAHDILDLLEHSRGQSSREVTT